MSDAGVRAHLGIPYAAPPTGARRWGPPGPPAAPRPDGDGPGAFGPAPPQPERPIGLWFHGPTPPTDEDCLTLNVWSPARGDDAPRPVLVWLHGGGWTLGFSGSPLFHGAALAAAADAVVVTLNYRLGSLGWLNHPALGANWGLQDQVGALRWVREHIAAFGGDPGEVTLWGQSAGAGSVLHLLASPLGEGLFARAIAQSPPLGELTVPAARGQAWAHALSAQLTGRPGFDVAALRGVSAGAVVAAHEALLATPEFRGTRGGAMPVVEAATLPVDPRQAPAARPEVPVLIGTTADEGTFLFRAAGRHVDPDDDRLRAMVAHLPDIGGAAAADAAISAARRADDAPDNNTVLCRLATRQLFAGPAEEWAAARAAAGGRVHRYRVEHRSPEAQLGAVHTVDVSLVFRTYTQEIGARVAGDGAEAAAVSAAMVAAWRAFVHGAAPWPEGELAVFGGGRPALSAA